MSTAVTSTTTIFYLLFSSGELQDWAKDDETEGIDVKNVEISVNDAGIDVKEVVIDVKHVKCNQKLDVNE